MRLQAIDPANLSKKRRLARARLSSIVPTLNMAYLTEVAVLLLLLALLLQLLLLVVVLTLVLVLLPYLASLPAGVSLYAQHAHAVYHCPSILQSPLCHALLYWVRQCEPFIPLPPLKNNWPQFSYPYSSCRENAFVVIWDSATASSRTLARDFASMHAIQRWSRRFSTSP